MNSFGLRIVTLISIIGLLTCSAPATVAPTLRQMIQGSHILVLGRVTQVQNPGGQDRIITLSIVEVLRPSPDCTQPLGMLREIKVPYSRFGKGNISFQTYLNNKELKIFGLNFAQIESDSITTLHLVMSDARFGVLDHDGETLELIHALNKDCSDK